jgi:ferric-dicitrate binding protein FerR (iron transport regulator)
MSNKTPVKTFRRHDTYAQRKEKSKSWSIAMGFGCRLATLRKRRLILALSSALAVVGSARADDAAPEIGTAVVIKREVVATLGEDKRDLKEGVRVHRSELLQTGDDAQAELKLDDQTKLALGPNAGLKLDEFVIGKSEGVTTIGVNFLKGTFRFITGSEKKDAYRIETPSATIGVRGTVFDVYVDGSGGTLVLLHEGEVNICTRTNTCRRHNTVGRIIHATVAGVLSAPIKFTNGLIPGIGVGAAFPFVGKVLRIDPIRRLRTAQIIERPVTKAGRAITGGARKVGRTLRKAVPF